MKSETPRAVQALLAADDAARYIDVRSVAEFAAGRPLLPAVNLPFAFRAPQRNAEVTNVSFVELASFLFTAETRLVIGGDADDRAERACAALRAAGFVAVSLLPGGIAAWRAALLPTTRDNREGVSYVSLLTRYRRRHARPPVTSSAHETGA